MKSDDHDAAINAAIATVREGFAKYYHDPGEAKLSAFEDATELLTRELVRLIDAGEAVRVKGLEWKSFRDEHRGNSVFGELKIWYEADVPGWAFWYPVMPEEIEQEYIGDGENVIVAHAKFRGLKTLDECKAKAEQWYRARLAAALEPLFAKEVGR